MIWSALSNTMRKPPQPPPQPPPPPPPMARTPAVNPNAPIPNMPRDARQPQPVPTVAPSSLPDLPNKVTAPTNQPLPPVASPRFPIAPTSPLTPGFNPEAVTPPIPTRQQPEQEYGVKRDWKNVARNAALGGFQGMARTGTWQGGVAGAATAGGMSAISPQIGMEYWKTQAEQPREDAQLAREAAINGRAQEQAYNQARIDNAKSEIENRRLDNERQDAIIKRQQELVEIQKRNANQIEINGDLYDRQTMQPIIKGRRDPNLGLVMGEDGKPYRVDLNDPANLQKPAYVTPDRNAEDTYNVPGLGVVKRRGGDLVTAVDAPEKDDSRARTTAASKDIEGYNTLQSKVVALGNEIQSLPPTDPEYQRLSAEYNAQRQQLKTESDRIKSTHGEAIEDVGQGGWSYFRVKPQAKPSRGGNAGAASGGKTFPASEVTRYAQANGVDETEAKRRIQASGYTIR